MKHYKIGIIILSLILISSNVWGACLTNSRQKVTPANKKALSDLNLLRVKLQKRTLQADSIIDKHMVDIANIPNYENLDSLRKNLREKRIYDYNVKLFKFKRNENISTLGLDIENNYPEVLKAIKDSDYNKVGIYQTQTEVTLLLVKSYMSIELSEATAQYTKDTDGKEKTEVLYINLLGKTTKKLYYKILNNSSEARTIVKGLRKSDDIYQDGKLFNLKVSKDVNCVEFVDENDSTLYIYNI